MLERNKIELLLADVENDERLWYRSANIGTNAPLALIQMCLETQSDCYRNVLGLDRLNFIELREKRYNKEK